MDLADVLMQALAAKRNLINETARKWRGHPIQIDMTWQPRMSKLDIVIRPTLHLPPYRPIWSPDE